MRVAAPFAAAAASFCAFGCGMDLGMGAACQLRDQHSVYSGHVAASSKLSTPQNYEGILLGAELQGREEVRIGSRWTVGVRAGYGKSPEPSPWSVGWEAHVDAGTPLGSGGLFANWSYYVGGTAAANFWLSTRHESSDLNTSSWFLIRGLELVPYVQGRLYLDRSADEATKRRLDLGGGLALRLRVISDFL